MKAQRIIIKIALEDEDRAVLFRSGVAVRIEDNPTQTIVNFAEGMHVAFKHVTRKLTGITTPGKMTTVTPNEN